MRQPSKNPGKEYTSPPAESKQPVYEITIDRGKLPELDIPQEMKDWLGSLPQKITFADPVILIVGENGSGKTSLGKAIMNARANALAKCNPTAKTISLSVERGEPASQIEGIVTCTEIRSGPNFRAYSIDGNEIARLMKAWAVQQSTFDERHRQDALTGGAYTHKLSTRQLFDQALEEIKERISRGMFAHIDFLFDEPEQGMSPWRQLQLVQDITEFPQPGDSMLVPTNSMVLYLSDLSRLDLSRPERGVFKPSDFGEFTEINLLNGPA